ncbi:MAG: UDP-glucose/GDP-mannose dehydrogenase family protein [Patescibacteria group bacterium]|nr:UDP-glucose/GDP-mannose dehydrogenase family protein [Patescibacteria group bacterium]MDD5491018.1 UDP-glucose/GDP-mannose dehydrogenase family protein [Patescibacteria group bacterium]
MKISIIGAGYIGLTSGAIFADLGNTVWMIRRDKEKIEDLKKGICPIYEPGLEEIIRKNLKVGRLFPTTDYAEAVPNSDAVFICVGTPSLENGEADLSQVKTAAQEIAKYLQGYTVIIDKSTVPIGTGDLVKDIVSKNAPQGATFDVVSCPEFLREGSAVNDSLNPDRIVIGCDSPKALAVMLELHKPLPGERVLTDVKTAEMIKYASNALLATEISFINSIANICERSGADVTKVAAGIRLDKRIGKYAFLDAGCGYGGACFPKDVKALISLAKDYDYDFSLLKEVEEVNKNQRKLMVGKVKKLLPDLAGKTIAVWGLAFKPNTDDMREAPSVDVIEFLQKEGAKINAFDPVAEKVARKILQDVHYFNDCYESVRGADCLVIITDWNEFKELDLNKVKDLMAGKNIVDGRNIYDPQVVRDLGFNYLSIGRV